MCQVPRWGLVLRKTSSYLVLARCILYHFSSPQKLWCTSRQIHGMFLSDHLARRSHQPINCIGLRNWREKERHLLIKSRQKALMFHHKNSQFLLRKTYTVMLVPKAEEPRWTWAEHQLTAWMGLHLSSWPTGFSVSSTWGPRGCQ